MKFFADRHVVKISTLGGGGGGRHVLTNFSYNFDQVVEKFPENVVDGAGGGGGGSKNFPD